MDSMWYALLSKIVKFLGTKSQNTQSTKSLQIPPVIITGQPPFQNSSPALQRKSKIGFLTLMDQGHSTRKSSNDAKGEAETERSVTAGTLANPKPSTASLDSRKSNDSTKGKPQTATMAQPIASSDSSASHTHRSSLPISHSSFSQKNDVLEKGQVASAGDNTLIANVTSLATDPSHLSSFTAPAVNISPQSQGEIQADLSVSNDPSDKTQPDDVEDTKFSNQHFVLPSRGRKCVAESRGSKPLKFYELLMLPELLIWIGFYLAEYSISYKPVKHDFNQIEIKPEMIGTHPLSLVHPILVYIFKFKLGDIYTFGFILSVFIQVHQKTYREEYPNQLLGH